MKRRSRLWMLLAAPVVFLSFHAFAMPPPAKRATDHCVTMDEQIYSLQVVVRTTGGRGVVFKNDAAQALSDAWHKLAEVELSKVTLITVWFMPDGIVVSENDDKGCASTLTFFTSPDFMLVIKAFKIANPAHLPVPGI